MPLTGTVKIQRPEARKLVSFGLRLSDLSVPAAVIRGDSVWLNCTYTLEGDDLYSIKWYKNSVEFYRFLPSDFPPGQTYDLLGIYLDMSKSSHGHIFLHKTDIHSEGVYRCEVSAEAPSFQTVRDEKELKIYVFPKQNPTISGTRLHYRVGDEVNVSCEAGPSRPAALLKWYINGSEVPPEFLRRPSPFENKDGLLSSRLDLNFVARQHHFWHGTMKLRCESLISQAHSMSSEEIVITNNPKASEAISGSTGDGPTITGGRPKYQVGDLVNVNCTAAKSRPPAEIHWYINDREARSEYLIPHPPLLFSDDQEATLLGLRFIVRPKHFQRGEMRLKCTSTLSKVVNMSSEETIVNNRQQSSGLHVSVNTGTVSSGGCMAGQLLWILMTIVSLTKTLWL